MHATVRDCAVDHSLSLSLSLSLSHLTKREFVTDARFTKVTKWLVFLRDCDLVFYLLFQ
jgi:hypothetical protein